MKKPRDKDPRFLVPKVFSRDEICRATDFVREMRPDIFSMIESNDRANIIKEPEEWRDKMSQLVQLLTKLKITDNLSDVAGLMSKIRAEIRARDAK